MLTCTKHCGGFCRISLKLKVDESIGERPVVSLAPRAKENQVLTARFTAVLRVALFVISNLKEEE